MSKQDIYQQIGEMFFEAGFGEVFDIQDNDNLKEDPEYKLSLLAGFIEEAVDGGLADPNNVIKWEARGEQLLNAKCTR